MDSETFNIFHHPIFTPSQNHFHSPSSASRRTPGFPRRNFKRSNWTQDAVGLWTSKAPQTLGAICLFFIGAHFFQLNSLFFPWCPSIFRWFSSILSILLIDLFDRFNGFLMRSVFPVFVHQFPWLSSICSRAFIDFFLVFIDVSVVLR